MRTKLQARFKFHPTLTYISIIKKKWDYKVKISIMQFIELPCIEIKGKFKYCLRYKSTSQSKMYPTPLHRHFKNAKGPPF